MKLEKEIIGEKIILRNIVKGDVGLMIAMANDPVVARYTFAGWAKKTVEQFWRKLREWQKGEEVFMVTVTKKTGEYLGYVSLSFQKKNDLVEFGIMLRSEEHGKGYGTEAGKLAVDYIFEKYPKVHKISLQAFAENVAAKRCYEKVGFVQEGILREEFKWEDGYRDVLVMGILRAEWEK